VRSDNSPMFKSLPPNFLCLDAPLTFDHSAIDADGDSLVYQLYTPFAGASKSAPIPAKDQSTNPAKFLGISWLGSAFYNENNQIDGQPGLSINRTNGKLTLTPTIAGQFVIGIKVMEFRKGVCIGETKRDFQFNVSPCVFSVVASLWAPKVNCTNNQVVFVNRSQGGTSYAWDFGDPSLVSDTSVLKSPVYNYQHAGPFPVRLVARTSICSDTFTYDLEVRKNFKTTLAGDTLICGPFSKVLASNQRNKSFLWSTGQTTETIKVNKGGTYWVAVSDGPCISRDTVRIINDLEKIELGPDSVICSDSFVQFRYKGQAGFLTYLWNDASTSQSVRIRQPGTYYVHAVNSNHCASGDSIKFFLYPPPRIELHDTLFCGGNSVVLDASNHHTATSPETLYEWSNGLTTPKITVFSQGNYSVKVSNHHCTVEDTVAAAFIQSGLELGPDTFYCGPVNRVLKLAGNYQSYTWQGQPGNSSYHITAPGMFVAGIVTKEGCFDSDSIRIAQYQEPEAGLGNDTSICMSSVLYIEAVQGMNTYLWNTGNTSAGIEIRDSGQYIVTVTDRNGCIISDSVWIHEAADAMPADLFIPNAFSPNKDQLNEYFPGNNYRSPGSAYDFRIYNRWGEMIFQGLQPEQQWDGTIDNREAPQEVYIYMVKYVGCDAVERWFRGTFTLLR
jgi:gliding motility-associated-like protein